VGPKTGQGVPYEQKSPEGVRAEEEERRLKLKPAATVAEWTKDNPKPKSTKSGLNRKHWGEKMMEYLWTQAAVGRDIPHAWAQNNFQNPEWLREAGYRRQGPVWVRYGEGKPPLPPGADPKSDWARDADRIWEDVQEYKTKKAEEAKSGAELYGKSAHATMVNKAVWEDNKPVNAEAVDEYQISLPDHYRKEGDMYVPQEQPSQPAAPAPDGAQGEPATGPLAPVETEAEAAGGETAEGTPAPVETEPVAAEVTAPYEVGETLFISDPDGSPSGTADYRGPDLNDPNKSVVWTGKAQISVQNTQLSREEKTDEDKLLPVDTEPAASPDVPSDTAEVDAAPPAPMPKTKAGLVEELLGPKPDAGRDAQGTAEWNKRSKSLLKLKKADLVEQVESKRTSEETAEREKAITFANYDAVEADLASREGNWSKNLKAIAVEHGLEGFKRMPDNNKGEEIYRIARWLTDRGVDLSKAPAAPAQPKAAQEAAPASETEPVAAEITSGYEATGTRVKVGDTKVGDTVRSKKVPDVVYEVTRTAPGRMKVVENTGDNKNLPVGQEVSVAKTTFVEKVAPAAPAQPEAPQEAAPAGEGAVVPRVYRETSLQGAEAMLPNSTTSDASPFGFTEFYVATSPDLALGQGTNKGVLVELDPEGLDIKDRKKPGQPSEMEDLGKEQIISARSSADLRPNVVSVTVRPKAEGTAGMKGRIKLFLNSLVKERGWSRDTLENGSIKYSRPDTPPAASANEVETKPEEAPDTQVSEEIAAKREGDNIDAARTTELRRLRARQDLLQKLRDCLKGIK